MLLLALAWGRGISPLSARSFFAWSSSPIHSEQANCIASSNVRTSSPREARRMRLVSHPQASSAGKRSRLDHVSEGANAKGHLSTKQIWVDFPNVLCRTRNGQSSSEGNGGSGDDSRGSLYVLQVDDYAWWDAQNAKSFSNPYGAMLWPAGFAVAQILATLPAETLQGMRVLELGCGNGLCSLVAAARGAQVVATDIGAEALKLTAAAASEQHLAVETRSFDLADTREPLPPADLVVVADMLYEEELAVVVAKRVAEAANRGSWVIVGDARRIGRNQFLKILKQRVQRSSGTLTYDFGKAEDETSVQLAAVGWKNKLVGFLRINEPLSLSSHPP